MVSWLVAWVGYCDKFSKIIQDQCKWLGGSVLCQAFSDAYFLFRFFTFGFFNFTEHNYLYNDLMNTCNMFLNQQKNNNYSVFVVVMLYCVQLLSEETTF